MSQEQDKRRAQRERWINAHLDGLLKPDQQEQFRRALSSSKSLRDELETQSRIDESLRRSFAPPSAEDILARATGAKPAAATPPQKARRRFWTPAVKYTAIAAALLLLAGGGWWTWLSMQDAGAPTLQIVKKPEATSRSLYEVFADTVRQGFKPVWVCENDKQFFQTTYERFGHGLMLAATLPKDHKALGWSYGISISPTSAYLLCEANGRRSIVFIDKLERDKVARIDTQGDLSLHRREIGEMVLYEVTESSRPQMLEYFYEKDPGEVPDDWKESSRQVRPPTPGRG
ncbi:MAG: hypothetical protein DCC65_18470 [Planctomycetota bacterium]|nr:MAG: hypothetical protein DCC65_18470 [Planctomycetota bacterium]